MKVDPKLSWLVPYYEEVKDLLPPKARLTKLNHIPLAKGKIQRIYANLWKYEKSYNYELSIYTEYWELQSLKPLRRKRKRYSKLDILQTFAHELAHMVHWLPHSPKHKVLECLICSIFMKKLEDEGYISEEDELKS